MSWQPVAPAEALQEGIARVFSVGDDAVLLVRLRGIIHATAPLCPHKFTSLEEGAVGTDGTITCELHHACFALATGAPQPGSEFAGRLPVYPTRIENGFVEVQLR